MIKAGLWSFLISLKWIEVLVTIFLQILFKILAIKYNKGIIKPMANPLHYFSFYLCLLQVKIGGYSIVFKPNDTQIRGLKPLFFSWWLVGKKNHANLHKDPPPSICGVIKGAFILANCDTVW